MATTLMYVTVAAALTLVAFNLQVSRLFALGLFKAGNSSFTPLQETSFWTSKGGNYSFGFQAINHGEGDDYLLSIWHSGDANKTAIWWPASSNAVNYDPTVKAGAVFHFARTGSLELQSSNGTLLWSTNTSSPYAELQDNGNLVLFSSNESSTSSWQSFNDSRNSLMLAGLDSITVAAMPFLLQSRINLSSYTTGRFRLQTDSSLNVELHALDYLGHDFPYLYGAMSTQKGNFSISRDSYRTYNNNTLIDQKRLTLDDDGNVRVYTWDANSSSWRQLWQLVTRKCLLGAPCGPFGICNGVDGTTGKANCSCPPGYEARDINDSHQGCKSSIAFNASCTSSNFSTGLNYTPTMVEVPNTDYDYNDLLSPGAVGLQQCKQICLDRCAHCIASVYLKASSICFIKGDINLGYLMNGYYTNATTLFLKSNTVQRVQVGNTKRSQRGWAAGIGAAVLVLVLIVLLWLMLWRKSRRKRHLSEAIGDVGPVRFYPYDELKDATRNFSEKLGEGGFGIVYKGLVRVANRGFDTEDKMRSSEHDDDAQVLAVAVKVLQNNGPRRKHAVHGESHSQFRAEINTLGQIHHVNLVNLVGYSYRTIGRKERILVYEYMEKGSLDKHLSLNLPWCTRRSIALSTASGIAYLHHECSPPILHCDIKPHNILLDVDFTPKVADFGFAKRFHQHRVQSSITMSAIRGTYGYIAPEWYSSDELTSKSDVYSFGIVLLELVRGFRASAALEDVPVVEWAMQCISKGRVTEFTGRYAQEATTDTAMTVDTPSAPVDDHLQQDVQQEEANEKLKLLKVGMWCIQHTPSMRLPMSRVIQLMEGTVPIEDPPIPPYPRNVPILRVPSLGNSSSTPRCYSYSSFSAR